MNNSIEVNATLPTLQTVPTTKVEGYLVVARELLPGVEALSTVSTIPPRAAAMLAAHALECVLHAFLLHKGVKADRNRETWHGLTALWQLAYEQGLGIPETPPDWCRILRDGHGPNFYFRYQKGEGGTIVNGGPAPELVPMTAALKELLRTVEVAVKA